MHPSTPITTPSDPYQEAAKFSEVQGFGLTDVKQIALKMAALPKLNTKRARIVIITQGAEAVVAVVGQLICCLVSS